MLDSTVVARGVALLLLLGLSAPAAFAARPPRRLFVLGDSLARDSSPDLHRDLRRWRIEENLAFARLVSETVHDLRVRARKAPPLAPVIHVSSGTGDDPARPKHFRHAVRQVMRVAGKHRCVVWANIWRLKLSEPTYKVLNDVLADEDLRRKNLRVVDWHSMVEAHRGWLVDLVHVNAAGNRARADAIARATRACRHYLTGLEKTHPRSKNNQA